MTPHEIRTSGLLAAIADGPAEHAVTFAELLERFSRRAFGVVILVATLPAFLPLPAGAGAVSGPLVALFGLQLLFGLRHPWIPARWARRGVRRERFSAFGTRLRPWLLRIERLAQPRWEILLKSLPGNIVSGLMLFVLGVLLSLPIPLTNYPLALLILMYAIALIERDGVLMVVAWAIGIAACIALIGVSDGLISWVDHRFG